MFTSLLLMAFGAFIMFVSILCWSLCEAAARADQMYTPDCFSRYRAHLLTCPDCDPPRRRCPVGIALRLAAVEDFTDKYLTQGETNDSN